MKTVYGFITFEKVDLKKKRKTQVWSCINRKADRDIGTIMWYPQWRQYCYFPELDTVYSAGCCEDIAGFINQLMLARIK